ncbi:putative LRR receptor-like serine/threonine-protein kinase-like isoform 1 [Capsicum annuum]|nr:putative LRR receptor-like serine/threonine-protein kinase-like isoform 1 [Capsicum annuum]
MTSRRVQNKMAMSSKLYLLRKLTNSKSVKKNSIIFDAFLYIIKLRLQLQAIQREYQQLLNHVQEVKVEKLVGTRFLVKVTCKTGKDVLVSILEAFEDMKLSVIQARVTSKYFYGMEAIVEVENEVNLDVKVLTKALQMAIHKKNIEKP